MASNSLRIYLDNEREGPLFRRGVERQGDRVRSAIRGAASDAAVEIEARGDADIEAGGNFGERWTDAFKADVSQGGGNIRIDVGFDGDDTVNVAWPVFEYGANIMGKPLLAIPLSFAGVPQGLFARDYPGGLTTHRSSDGVRKSSGGNPLLYSIEDYQPKYFLTKSVYVPQKWHLREIIRQVANELKNYFKDRMS